MSGIHPTVRYLIVCEDVRPEPDRPRAVTLVSLTSALKSLEDPPFPFLYRELCVFLQLTECRGPANGRIEIRHAETDQPVIDTTNHVMSFPNDPLEIVGAVFRLQNLYFPEPGLYWVQFWYNDDMIAQQPLMLR